MKLLLPFLILCLPALTQAKEVATETAYFGAGCFWCVEAVFEKTDGVKDVVSGYQNGSVDNPTYRQVTSGKTGHAEVVKVVFNPKVISFDQLLDVFFTSHDPTTLNRQGADRGTQYRSAILYTSDAQKATAEASKKKWDASGKFDDPIVTEITQAETFYEAEGYHQDYFRNNPYAPYSIYIRGKLKKLGIK